MLMVQIAAIQLIPTLVVQTDTLTLFYSSKPTDWCNSLLIDSIPIHVANLRF